MFAIETQHLSKFYSRGKVKALQDFSLTVEQGKIFGLLGPNGAGKTTFIKIVLGIIHPNGGKASILGKPITDYKVHRHIGYLSEKHHFPGFLTAGRVLYYFGKMSGLTGNALEKRMDELLELVKLSDWKNHKVREFSKGMQQRLGLAHALINDPKLIFLDEPTDGIDPVGRREIRDLLQLLRDQGKTIFLNSHLLSEVERISDEIAILKDGRLLKKGPVHEFLAVDRQYQLKIAQEKNTLEAICQKMSVTLSQTDGAFMISVKNDEQLNELIDRLRSSKVLIRAIVPYKISLEDFFIDVIEENEGDGQ